MLGLFLAFYFFSFLKVLVPVSRKYTITLTTFVLNVVLSPPGDLAKGSLGKGAMRWERCGEGVCFLFDFYGAIFTGIYSCLSSPDLFTEMIKQS